MSKPPLVAERIPPTSEWEDDTTWFQLRIPADLEYVDPEGKRQSFIDSSYGVAERPDNSNSLFSNQDSWISCYDTHFPPPRPSIIQIRREAGGARDAPGASHSNTAELQIGNCKELNIEIPLEDATWETSKFIHTKFPSFEPWGQGYSKGRDVMRRTKEAKGKERKEEDQSKTSRGRRKCSQRFCLKFNSGNSVVLD